MSGNRFDHEKLKVYQAALELIVDLDGVAQQLPRGKGHLADQLRRAATSIPLNIAEGAGEFSQRDKARFYRIARRSATECAAILDVCVRLDHFQECDLQPSRECLLSIVSMLTKMAQRGP